MDFNKNELHLLKFLWFYKLLSIGCMIFGSLGIPFGLYISFSRPKSYAGTYLNNALIGASMVVLGMGYVMYCLVKIIDKFKKTTEKGKERVGA
jgi:hypothetical protein